MEGGGCPLKRGTTAKRHLSDERSNLDNKLTTLGTPSRQWILSPEGGPEDRKGEEKDEEGELNIIEYDEEEDGDYHHQNSESHHI